MLVRITSVTNFFNEMLDNLMFKKPGPAISIFEKSFISSDKSFLILEAKSFGVVLLIFARIKAILHEIS